jgi:hypothetical protein
VSSRFGWDEGTIPWDLWEPIVARALAGPRGQAALAEMEEALLALPEHQLTSGALAEDGHVCAIGAAVAYRRAKEQGRPIEDVISELSSLLIESAHETSEYGERLGFPRSLAWHFAWLNDEEFHGASPAERWKRMVAFVQRAQGKEVTVAA